MEEEGVRGCGVRPLRSPCKPFTMQRLLLFLRVRPLLSVSAVPLYLARDSDAHSASNSCHSLNCPILFRCRAPCGLSRLPIQVERNMRLRRKRILSVLRDGEVAPTMTCFPLMGVGDFVAASTSTVGVPPASPRSPRRGSSSGWHVRGPVANSAYIPDDVINPHPRFGALTKNIRVREPRFVVSI